MISKTSTILFTLLLIFSTYSAQLANKQMPVSTQHHLSDLLLAHLGLNSGKTSEAIKNYIEANKISLLDAVDQIALVFVDGQHSVEGNKFQITQQFVENMGNNMNKIKAHFLTGKSQEQVKSFISQNIKQQKYQQINVQTHQIAKIQQYFTSQMSAPAVSTRRVLEQTSVISQTQSTSMSYITKFFFIILFILVTMGSLFAIAAMDNKKDSLLYAKFLTDVSGR